MDYVIEGDKVDVPSAGVSLKVGKLAAEFFGVFLGIWSPLVLQSFADLAILGLVVGDGRNCILDCSGEVFADRLGDKAIDDRDGLGVVTGEFFFCDRWRLIAASLRSSSMRSCCLSRMSLSLGSSACMGGSRKIGEGGGIFLLATSSSSSRYPMSLAMNFCSISPINLDRCCLSAPR